MTLSGRGHTVDTCQNGRQGLEVISGGEYDLALLDLRLPDFNGIEILRIAKRDSPETYVIVMTGYSTIQNAVKAMKVGAFDYLAKPFSDDELIIAVDRALGNKCLKAENLTIRRRLSER